MSRAHHLPITALVLIAAVPLAWIACGGGESKPPESPASESSAAKSSEGPSASDTAPSASASPSTADTSSASSAATAEAAPPPTPTFGSTDCGQCVAKTCAKPEAACGKNTDCQSTLDSIHSCSSGAAACVDSPNLPSAAKPKKLATAYEACAKKAVAKACKAKCQ